MMNQSILAMIDEYKEKGDFPGQISDRDIKNAEKALGIKFPQTYKNFIKNYGSGGICGVEILGVEGPDHASVVNATNRFRNLGLLMNYLVIESVDEFIYCIDTKDEFKVIRWDDVSKKAVNRYSTFEEYLQDSFQEAIDNWD
jgi:hypothetical protein